MILSYIPKADALNIDAHTTKATPLGAIGLVISFNRKV